MTGIPVKRHSIPWDPADFGRCHRLLQAIPEWEGRIEEVAVQYPEWRPFVDNWPKMKEIYECDEPTERSPDLYNMMLALQRQDAK